MKICNHCGKKNPADTDYCYQCGNPVKNTLTVSMRRSFWSIIPSWAWIFIGVGGIVLFLILIMGTFYSLANFEGFASAIFLVLGVITFRVFSGQRPGNIPLIRAIIVGFFALMGATIDQTGNYVYNKPVEWCMCPEGTELNRATLTSHPLPGRTDMTQSFTCLIDGKPITDIDVLPVVGIRFMEYMLLAYLLLGLRWLIWKIRFRQKH